MIPMIERSAYDECKEFIHVKNTKLADLQDELRMARKERDSYKEQYEWQLREKDQYIKRNHDQFILLKNLRLYLGEDKWKELVGEDHYMNKEIE